MELVRCLLVIVGPLLQPLRLLANHLPRGLRLIPKTPSLAARHCHPAASVVPLPDPILTAATGTGVETGTPGVEMDVGTDV